MTTKRRQSGAKSSKGRSTGRIGAKINLTSQSPKTYEEAKKLRASITSRMTRVRTLLANPRHKKKEAELKQELVDLHIKRIGVIKEWDMPVQRSQEVFELRFEPRPKAHRCRLNTMNAQEMEAEHKRLLKERSSLNMKVAKARKIKDDKKFEARMKELQRLKAINQTEIARIKKVLETMTPGSSMRYVGRVVDNEGNIHVTEVCNNPRACMVERNEIAKKLISSGKLDASSPFAPISLNIRA